MRKDVLGEALQFRQVQNNRGSRAENFIKIKTFALQSDSTTTTSCLRTALLNVRSLVNKTFLVNNLISTNQLDHIFLTETWLDTTGNKELIETAPTNFNFSHCTRSHRKGGGIAFLYIICQTVPLGDFSAFECLAVVVKSVVPTLLLTVCHPPKLKKKVFLMNLQNSRQESPSNTTALSFLVILTHTLTSLLILTQNYCQICSLHLNFRSMLWSQHIKNDTPLI